MTKEHKERSKPTTWYGKFWHFLWYEDSVASWIVSIALAFILIKFVIYPGLGLVFGTQFPVVAVVSNSMEHKEGFDAWWTEREDRYLRFNITKSEFEEYPLRGGFDKGDIILLVGVDPEEVERGDVIVFWGGKQYPIIHRVVAVRDDPTGRYFETFGDNNLFQITPAQANNPYLDETHISTDQLVGRAVLRIPYLGWVKIGFVWTLNQLGIPAA